MSLYDSGCDDSSGLVEYSPRTVYRQLKAVNDFLSVVNADMDRDTKKTGNAGFMSTWRTEVYNPWLRFYKDAKGWDLTELFRDSTFKRAEAFRQLGLRFRENLQKKSDSTVTPTKVPDPVKSLGTSDKPVDIQTNKDSGLSLIPWRKIFIIGGITVGGYFAYRWYTSPARRINNLVKAREEREQIEQAVPIAEVV